MTLAAAAHRVSVGRGLRIGVNEWYLTPGATVSDVLKVRRGIVQEIGIASKQLTPSRRAIAHFLTSLR